MVKDFENNIPKLTFVMISILVGACITGAGFVKHHEACRHAGHQQSLLQIMDLHFKLNIRTCVLVMGETSGTIIICYDILQY